MSDEVLVVAVTVAAVVVVHSSFAAAVDVVGGCCFCCSFLRRMKKKISSYCVVYHGRYDTCTYYDDANHNDAEIDNNEQKYCAETKSAFYHNIISLLLSLYSHIIIVALFLLLLSVKSH